MARQLAGLLLELGSAGVSLTVDAKGLRHYPKELPERWVEGLRGHRAAVLALLTGERCLTTPDAAEAFVERMAIGDGLGMRTDRGGPCWLIAMGEALFVELGDAGTCASPQEPAKCSIGGL